MIITVHRDICRPDFTLSMWFVDSKFLCFGLEDTDRHLETVPDAKVAGKTAIPRGQYGLIISYSPRFKRDLPLLTGVPGFSGVRIHTGNRPEDTEGCLLPGLTRDTEAGSVGSSKLAFAKVMMAIKEAQAMDEQITVVIK